MNLLSKIFVLLLITGLYAPAFADVTGVEFSACSVLSEAEKSAEDETEEEPDCE